MRTRALSLEEGVRPLRRDEVEMARATDKQVLAKLYPNAKEIPPPERKE